MDKQTHQSAAAGGGTAFAVGLLIQVAQHYGYTIDAGTAVNIVGLASGVAVYVSQILAARGVKLPFPVDESPVKASIVTPAPVT